MKIEKRHLEKRQIHKKNPNDTSEHISPHFAIFGFAVVLPIVHTVWVLLFYNISNRNRIEITCLMQNHIKTFRIKCRTTVNKQRPCKQTPYFLHLKKYIKKSLNKLFFFSNLLNSF